MQFKRKITKNGSSLQFTIPLDMAKYLKLDSQSEIIIQDENGKLGPYASFWKKVNDNVSGGMENEELFN